MSPVNHFMFKSIKRIFNLKTKTCTTMRDNFCTECPKIQMTVNFSFILDDKLKNYFEEYNQNRKNYYHFFL